MLNKNKIRQVKLYILIFAIGNPHFSKFHNLCRKSHDYFLTKSHDFEPKTVIREILIYLDITQIWH